MESSPRGRSRGRDLSEEERNKLREQYRKVREERMKSMVLIEDQMLLLKGRRTVYQDYDKSMGQLNGLLESAKKEKAKETTAAIEKIIAAKKLEFEKRMKKLGMEERPRSRGSRSRSN
jgi:molecular chaperone DnaK (HSP70)